MYKGQRVGSFGDVGCFSFYPGKNLGAFGDAGGLVTNNDEIANFARHWRNCGSLKKYHHDIIGSNSRLDSIQAAVLDCKLTHMDKWNARRHEIACLYEKLIKDSRIPVRPAAMPLENTTSAWHLYIVYMQNPDER